MKTTMIRALAIAMLVGACLIAVHCELPGEPFTPGDGNGDDHGGAHGGGGNDPCVCTRNEHFIKVSFNQTCKQANLHEVKHEVHHISRDVKQIANTTQVTEYRVAELAAAQERSTNELKLQMREGFNAVVLKLAATSQMILAQSAHVIEEHQNSIDYLKQELLSQMQQNRYNITAQLAYVKHSCHDNRNKKTQLVWALKEQCVPLLVQQNIGGSNFFNRSWSEFKVGFNDTRGNYWLGNDYLSELTQTGRYKLRFDLQRHDNSRWLYAEYSTFLVYGEAFNYRLHVSGYSGTTGYDAMSKHNQMMFTTWDRDNDPWTNGLYHNNCAVYNGGGFWWTSYLGYCGGCDVNAVSGTAEDFSWDLHRGQIKLKTSRMWLECKH